MPADPNHFARDLFAPLPDRYDLLAEVLSFGQNGRWRSEMVDHVLPVGGVILDVASGTAGVALQLAARGESSGHAAGGGRNGTARDAGRGEHGGTAGDAGRGEHGGTAGDAGRGEHGGTAGDADGQDRGGTAGDADGQDRGGVAADWGVRVVGVDLTEQMLREGCRRVTAAGRDGQVGLVVGRAEQLPFPDGYFDALTFTYLLRYVRDPQATLTELARVLKPGGVMASLEFCVPTGALWHPAWWAYTRLALPAGGLLLGGREWFRVGRFLGPNISAHYRRYPVSWTVEAWQKAGLTGVGARVMSLGGGLVMWGTRAGA
jgi:demethylmenaquinone methyltransferase / 2-methoxy-6-polyprenyl-1,4-benzoquinol methylase